VRLDLFRARFADVELDTCFSTPAPALQAIGAKHFPDNTFGILLGALKRTDRLGDALARDDSDRRAVAALNRQQRALDGLPRGARSVF